MIFRETRVAGAMVIEPERRVDDRGAFMRVWCAEEFAAHGLDRRCVQSSLSTNPRRGTLRGLHYSVAPRAEAKVVRCVRGAVYDVLVDLRPGSPTYCAWCAETLTADNGVALYAPEGVAHGFVTLEDGTDMLYQMSETYDPACARGVRWDDPAFGVVWPEAHPIISERDRAYPDYARLRGGGIAERRKP
jgi:dTDP-4-dehydrorhamnose 3,5-epimerase